MHTFLTHIDEITSFHSRQALVPGSGVGGAGFAGEFGSARAGVSVDAASSTRAILLWKWGPPLAGKTSLIQRCSENIFNVQYHTVIGIDFNKARVFVDHSPMEIFLWDAPAGKERFQVMQAAHLRGKVAVLLVIDLASDEPFWKMDHFINRIEEASIVTKLMLGNKLDLEAERKLSREDAERFAADRGFHYFETSAKDGSGIEDCVQG